MCEDNDPDCRFCAGHCTRDSAVTLVKIIERPFMQIEKQVTFCSLCVEGALESGLFNVIGD
jgi:hypothetical protein